MTQSLEPPQKRRETVWGVIFTVVQDRAEQFPSFFRVKMASAMRSTSSLRSSPTPETSSADGRGGNIHYWELWPDTVPVNAPFAIIISPYFNRRKEEMM
jgi:hypothetical protein